MTTAKIKPDDESFTNLMQSVLGFLYDDLKEAEENVKRYEKLVTGDNENEMNLSIYGPMLNDALKIKASVRDKTIKMLATLKDRVRTKEAQNSGKEGSEDFTEEYLAELQEKLSKMGEHGKE